MTQSAGVDGFRGQWIIALVKGRSISLHSATSAQEVLTVTDNCDAIAVDVPMGLAENGVRPCEQAARDRLGPARSSVFPTPPRAVLAHVDDWPAALATARRVAGKGMSKQAFGILPGIRAFDELDVDPRRIVECHPELSFRALHDPGYVSKKTARGQGQRVDALSHAFDVVAALADVPDGPAMDDVLDAIVCAWTARRWAQGHAEVLGGEPDGRGKPMRIVV